MSAHSSSDNSNPFSPTPQKAGALNRILVIDDDPDTRQFCVDALTGSGYRVDSASDGESGWKVLGTVSYESDNYDLLITDNNMPVLTGLELIDKVRAARITVPIILVSGELPEVIRAAVDAKAPLPQQAWNQSLQISAALPKPFTIGELLQTVKEVLRLSSTENGRSHSG